MRPSQGFWGTGEKGYLFQRNKGQILRGTGEQRQYWGTGNTRKQIFYFMGTGEQANLFQGNKGTGTPPPRGVHAEYLKMIEFYSPFGIRRVFSRVFYIVLTPIGEEPKTASCFLCIMIHARIQEFSSGGPGQSDKKKL